MIKNEEAGVGAAASVTGQQEQIEYFEQAGWSPVAAGALTEIDQTMQRIRRGLAKRELISMVLKSMDPDMDPGHLDTLAVVMLNCRAAEVTVGFVAESLGVDPSRGSRLVSEMVEQGYLRRVASQADSRRICLELTERGEQFARSFHERKWLIMAQGLGDWTDDELAVFARLLGRFANATARQREREASREAQR